MLLSEETWREKRERHIQAVSPFTEGFRERRGRAESHPIYDFLFVYYAYSSSKLEQWHPGFEYSLTFASEPLSEWQKQAPYQLRDQVLSVDLSQLTPRALHQLKQVKALQESILSRDIRTSCLGLHEWAMIYKDPNTRHQYPLRLSLKQIEEILESHTYCCSHFDAFRFSTPAARPLNILQPGADSRLEFEQGGCLHANMDLYKCCFKLIPLISSDLLRECFFLALEARELDMEASPYDFSSLGFRAVKIETEEGKAEYSARQGQIARKAKELRVSLLQKTNFLLDTVSPGSLA